MSGTLFRSHTSAWDLRFLSEYIAWAAFLIFFVNCSTKETFKIYACKVALNVKHWWFQIRAFYRTIYRLQQKRHRNVVCTPQCLVLELYFHVPERPATLAPTSASTGDQQVSSQKMKKDDIQTCPMTTKLTWKTLSAATATCNVGIGTVKLVRFLQWRNGLDHRQKTVIWRKVPMRIVIILQQPRASRRDNGVSFLTISVHIKKAFL